jgi:hypothetical protein
LKLASQHFLPAWVLPTLAAAALTGCTVNGVATGPEKYESTVIDRDQSESAHVELNLGAGDLKVSSGTQKFLRAYFTYNVPQLKPNVHYSSTGGIGNLSIDQPESHTHIGHIKYEWDLRLNDELPLDLDVHFGAGEAHLDLGALNLRRVGVEMGVGQINMDLRGAPKHDYTVNIHGGVGEAEVRLPNTVGIEATASGGIGDISVRGLKKEAGHWVNEAFHNPGVKVRVDVQGGIGAIHLIAE